MSDKHNNLEEYIVEGLKPIDKYTRKTKGSGCGAEIGDVQNQFFFVESKIKHGKVNIIVDYKNEWLTLNSRIPLNSTKIPVVIVENKFGEKFVTMEAVNFFELVRKAFQDEN